MMVEEIHGSEAVPGRVADRKVAPVEVKRDGLDRSSVCRADHEDGEHTGPVEESPGDGGSCTTFVDGSPDNLYAMDGALQKADSGGALIVVCSPEEFVDSCVQCGVDRAVALPMWLHDATVCLALARKYARTGRVLLIGTDAVRRFPDQVARRLRDFTANHRPRGNSWSDACILSEGRSPFVLEGLDARFASMCMVPEHLDQLVRGAGKPQPLPVTMKQLGYQLQVRHVPSTATLEESCSAPLDTTDVVSAHQRDVLERIYCQRRPIGLGFGLRVWTGAMVNRLRLARSALEGGAYRAIGASMYLGVRALRAIEFGNSSTGLRGRCKRWQRRAKKRAKRASRRREAMRQSRSERIADLRRGYVVKLADGCFRTPLPDGDYDLVVAIAFHGRRELLRHVVDEVFRLGDFGWSVGVVLSCSDNEDAAYAAGLRRDYGRIGVTLVENQPLGRKWQVAVDCARLVEPRYLAITGSDDVVVAEYFDGNLRRLADMPSGRVGLLGVRSWYMMAVPSDDPESSDLMVYRVAYHDECGHQIPLGAGRIYSCDWLDSVDWRIFDVSRARALDVRGDELVRESGHEVLIAEDDVGFVMSVKGDWAMLNDIDRIKASHRVVCNEVNEGELQWVSRLMGHRWSQLCRLIGVDVSAPSGME